MHRSPGREAELDSVSQTPGPGPVAALASRDRMLVWACIAAVTVLAWGYLFFLDRQMAAAAQHESAMAAMGMSMDRAWTGADLAFTFTMWVVMMVGMMTGSAAPVMLLYAGLHARRDGRRPPLIVLAFGLGYLLVWGGFSVAATLAQWGLHEAALLSPAMALSDRQAAGVILCAAGIYQLTPFKRSCLLHCRSPLGFLLARWRDGKRGALRMGMRHGAFCLGCCWALMCVLFVTGVMNLVYVAALALLVLLEKLGPAGMYVARVAGVAMIGIGLSFLACAGGSCGLA